MSDASHKRSIVVWDVPSAIACGSSFSIKLGVKCEAGCRPDGWRLEVRDREGSAVAAAIAGDETWPGTEALYGTDLELVAPDSEGLHRFEAVALAVEPPGEASAQDDLAHEEARAGFNVRTVPEADCRLTVIAIDREKQAPVRGAKVVVHPYRAITDERGKAELGLPRGRYRLFVTGRDFFPLRLDGELTGDATIRAELELDLGPSDVELWA